MTRLEAIRRRVNAVEQIEGSGNPRALLSEEWYQARKQMPDDIRTLLACVDEMRGALEFWEDFMFTLEHQPDVGDFQQYTNQYYELRDTLASIEEKLR